MNGKDEFLIGADGKIFGGAVGIDIQSDKAITSVGEALQFGEPIKGLAETAAERALVELLLLRLSSSDDSDLVADAKLCGAAVRAAFDALESE